jgi:membrane protein implicated in regulation of membrane protease activity
MDLYVVVALIGVALLLAELLLSTGGVLAALGAAGLIAGGVLALTADSDSSASDWAGPALITVGILSIVSFYFITRKVLAAHRDQPVRGGQEELIGATAEVRTPPDGWAMGPRCGREIESQSRRSKDSRSWSDPRKEQPDGSACGVGRTGDLRGDRAWLLGAGAA